MQIFWTEHTTFLIAPSYPEAGRRTKRVSVKDVVLKFTKSSWDRFEKSWLWILLKWAVLRLYGCTQVGCFKALLKWAVLRLYDLDNFAGMGIQSTKKRTVWKQM